MLKKLFYLKLMCLVLFSAQINAQQDVDIVQYNSASASQFTYVPSSLCQVFKPANSGILSRIRLNAAPSAGTTGAYTIKVGSLVGTTFVLEQILSTKVIANADQYVYFDWITLDSPVELTANKRYFVSIERAQSFYAYHNPSSTSPPGFIVEDAVVWNGSTAFGWAYNGTNATRMSLSITYDTTAIFPNATVTNIPSGCNPGSIGSISLSPSNGTAPYSYAWSSSVSGFVNPGNVATISNLAAGTYACTITDSSTPNPRGRYVSYTVNDYSTHYDTYIKTDATCGNYGLTLYPIATKLVDRNFTQPTGFSVTGDAGWDSSLGDTFLVPDQTSKQGKLIINDMPTTLPSDFEVNYEFKMLNKSGADGYSFNLGNDSFAGAYEDGVNQGLAIKFKTYNQDQISVAWNGTQIVAPINFTVEKGYWMAVKVRVIGGKLTLYVDGSKIIDNVTITGYAQNNAYKMILAGRTGGVSNEIRIDNVSFANPTFESYSIDGTTFQTSTTFSNITLPTNRTLPIWLKQDGCAIKVRDFIYPDVITNRINAIDNLDNSCISIKTVGCDPTVVRVGGGSTDIQTNLYAIGKAYTNDFTTNDGYTYGGAAYKNNGIALTRNAIDNKGYLIVNKPESIDRDFEIVVSHKALNQAGADGFSINFGVVTPIVNETVSYENGVATGLAVRFKTFGQDNVSVFYNGVQVGTTVNTTIENGAINSLTVKVLSGLVTVSVNGSPLISQALPASYTSDSFTNHQFIVAARTGGAFNENLIKSITIYNDATLQASTDNITFTDLPTNVITIIPLAPANIVNDKTNVYLKYKEGCVTTRIVKDIVAYNTHAATPTGSSTQNYTPGVTKFQDLDIITVPGFELRWFTNLSYADNPGPNLSFGYLPNTLIPNGTTVVYAVAFKIGATSTDYGCPSSKKTVNLVDVLNNQSFEKLGAKMYPNPTTGSLILQLEDYNNTTVKIIDLNGRTIQNHTLSSTQSTFDVTHLSNGMYFLQINTDKGNATQKFIKQ